MEFTHPLSQKHILSFIRFSAYRTRIGTIPYQGERGHSETQFRDKKHRKRLSKIRDIQIRNSERITELELWKLNKDIENAKERTR